MDALSACLASPELLDLISLYITLPDFNKEYQPPKRVVLHDNGDYECEMTKGSLKKVVKISLLRKLREIKQQYIQTKE